MIYMNKLKGKEKDYINTWIFAKNYDHSKTLTEIKTYFNYLENKEFIDDVGLNLQICIKKSRPMYLHGYVLTSALHHYLTNNNVDNLTILETGTARGFSAICMSKILKDFNKNGTIHTLDILSLTNSMYWNCINDTINGKCLRKDLLNKWSDLKHYIKLYECDTNTELNKLNFERIHFAFLDGNHKYNSILNELNYVKTRQLSGDVIVCDDYTEKQFPGIYKAINDFINEKQYKSKIFYGNDGTKKRGYVYMIKI